MALIQCNFFSRCINRTIPMQIILPTDKESYDQFASEDKPLYRTLYLLHGLFGNYTDWVSFTRIQIWAQENNLAVVMPSADNRFYVDNPVSGELYGTFIQEELVSFTRRSFPLSCRREDTFIGGLSMGGYGAIVNALTRPDIFSSVCALSAATIISDAANAKEYTSDIFSNRGYVEAVFGPPEQLLGSDKDYYSLADRAAKSGFPLPRFFMACGTEDDLLDSNRAFRDHLLSLGYSVDWKEDAGGHDWIFWDTYIKHFLDWLRLDQ